MAKTKEELETLKKECSELSKKMKELTPEEMKQISAGGQGSFLWDEVFWHYFLITQAIYQWNGSEDMKNNIKDEYKMYGQYFTEENREFIKELFRETFNENIYD